MPNLKFQQQVQKTREQRRLMLEQLMYTQMKENLGKNISQYVENTKKLLIQVGPNKTRKVIVNVQKNLSKFLRGTNYADKFKFGQEMLTNVHNSQAGRKTHYHKMFNEKLLEKQLRRTHLQPSVKKEEGALYRNLIKTSRKNYRKRYHQNIILVNREGESYCSSQQQRQRNKKFFDMIIDK